LVRPPVTATPQSAADLPPRAAELVAAQIDTVAAVAEGCDALVATGVMLPGPSAARTGTTRTARGAWGRAATWITTTRNPTVRGRSECLRR
jgi:hypothetical protein